MKKKICLIMIMFILSITNVYALNVEVEDININNHSNTITLGDYSITGNTINSDITFNKLNDYVTYEIKFKNNDKYTIESITDDNNNEYVKTSYKYDKNLSKPISITLTYIKETKELSLDNINITIKLLSNKGKEEVLEVKINKSNDILKEVPGTGILISVTLSLISMLLIGYLYLAYYRKKKNVSTMILILGLLLIPVSIVMADSEKISLIINTENIKVHNSPWKIESQSVPGTLSVGDELSVDTEHFYVVSSDEEKTVLLAKYNLYVGNIKNNDEEGTRRVIEETEEGYGLQSEKAKGWVEEGPYIGGVQFRGVEENMYWYDGTTEIKIKSEYGSSFPAYVYDKNNILYDYVENYIIKLHGMGADNISGRMISYEEVTNLGCVLGCASTDQGCPLDKEWLFETSYWLGSITSRFSLVNYISTLNCFDDYMYYSSYYNGLRPVIEVNTRDIGL